MRKAFRILGHVVKATVVVALGAIGRISRGQGKGVVEQAIQDAIYDIATYYMRSVKPA